MLIGVEFVGMIDFIVGDIVVLIGDGFVVDFYDQVLLWIGKIVIQIDNDICILCGLMIVYYFFGD